jgi:ribosomal protein S27E
MLLDGYLRLKIKDPCGGNVITSMCGSEAERTDDLVGIFVRLRCSGCSAEPVLFRRLNRSGRLLCNICLQVVLSFWLWQRGVERWEGPRKKAASLSFDSKQFKQSQKKPSFYAKHTAFRNDVKNSFLDVTPCDLREA